MRNAMWVGGGITGMGEIPMLGTPVKGLTAIIRKIFHSGAEGFAYDPNDLTAEKINWRKNQLLNTDDFTYETGGNYTAVKEADGWALTAIAQTSTGYNLLGNQYPIGAASDSNRIGTIIRSIEVKKGTGVFRFGAASNNAAIFVNTATMTAIDPPTGLKYTITPIGSDWYRIETFFYGGGHSSSVLSNSIGWSTAKATTSTLDTTNQVGTVVRVRNPSFAFVPYETTESIPYQAISDFNSDFIRAFPTHTLYQDAVGSVPVTAAGQPVGLILDKSKPLTNTSILDSTFLLADGWVKSSPEISVTNVGGSLRISKEALLQKNAYKPFSCESGKLYRLTVKYKNHTGNNVRFFVRNANGLGVNPELSQTMQTGTSTDGVGITFFISNSDTHTVSIDSQNAAESSVDVESIVITKVSDSTNHAYQTTSASRPILQQSPILGNNLVVNGDFSAGLTNWTQQGDAISTVSEGVLSITAQGSTSGVYQDIPTVVGGTYELDFSSTSLLRVVLYANSGFSPAIPNSSAPRTTFVATSSVTRIYAYCNGSGTGTLDNISLKHLTGYRTDQSYLAFDGADDFLQTSNIDFTATDKLSLFAGVRKLSDTPSYSIVCELSVAAVTNAGAFNLQAPGVTADKGYASDSNGSRNTTAKAPNYSAPHSAVLSFTGNISAPLNRLRVNSSNFDSVVSQGTGNYGNYPLYLGRREGTTLPFGGHLYSLIGIGRLTTESESKALERIIAKNTGVDLIV